MARPPKSTTGRTRFVAEFTGPSNLLAGPIEAAGLRINDAVWPIRVASARPGDLVTVLVRPEHLVLEPANHPNTMAGSIAGTTFLGATCRLVVQCDNGLRLLVEEPSTAEPHGDGLGKTGRFFAFENFGAQPEFVVLGKALGGGMLPIAAVLSDARFDIAPELALGHYTHEKNR